MKKRQYSLDLLNDWIGEIEAKYSSPEGLNANESQSRATVHEDPIPIAITGLSGYFPNSMDVESFLKYLEEDKPLTSEVLAERFKLEDFVYATDSAVDTKSIKWAGFIPDIASFDPKLFNILPIDANEMDPRQRLLLMSTWKTLEDAGIAPSVLKNSKTGVFIAGETNDYAQLMKSKGFVLRNPLNQEDSMLANCISYYFGFLGPSEIINTMCSGFAVALHRAVVALRIGEIDRAIVGAANIILQADRLIALSKSNQLSTQQIVQSFGKEGDGYLCSEAVGTIMIERLTDARKHGRYIYANIRNTAVNYNKPGGMSISSPNIASHTELIKDCYLGAKIDPTQLSYIEAQGMGLPVADIAEWTAMNRALTELIQERSQKVVSGQCSVSTLKPIAGHMHSASSFAALIKIIGSFKSNKIYKILGYSEPNEYCDMQNGPCKIVRENEVWKSKDYRRLAALHSYGSGGNNAHVLLEETAVEDSVAKQSLVPKKMELVHCWFHENEPEVLNCEDKTSFFMSSLMSPEQIVRKIIAPFLQVDENDISLVSSFRDLGFNSIHVITLCKNLKEHHIDINPATFFEFIYIEDLVIYIKKNFLINNDLINSNSFSKKLTQKKSVSKKNTKKIESDIAVVGMSAQFPGADNLDEFWKNLTNGVDCIQEIPSERWDWESWYGDASIGERTDCKWGGFINGHDTFDPLFFNISPREALFMDPQIRKVLEKIWHAIEDSGYLPTELWGKKVGVFIGLTTGEYQSMLTEESAENIWSISTSGLASLGIARISDYLNFKGPIDITETACSSSLVAIHKGINAIHNGDCELAIVGSCHLMLTPTGHISLRKSGAISSDGRCKAFSSNANGYGRGEGVGVMILDSLISAQQMGLPIYAIIKGSAVNHDGRSSSLTAPNPVAQANVIKEAQVRSGIEASTITYIEAHGTGTSLGDLVEIEGLKKSFDSVDERLVKKNHCAIGTVKSHIGHLEIAAGMSGLIKTVLQLQHKYLIKTLHCDEQNPHIDIEHTPFYILKENKKWINIVDKSGQEIPLRAGVSSFGLSGVNAHVILEEYTGQIKKNIERSLDLQGLFVLSAKTREALQQYSAEVLKYLKNCNSIDFEDFLYTFQVGREAMSERLAITCSNELDLINQLSAFLNGAISSGRVFVGSIAGRQVAAHEQSIAELWVNGHAINWHQTSHPHSKKRLSGLPLYPFAKERYWPKNQPNLKIPHNTRNSNDGEFQSLNEIMFFKEEWQVADLPVPTEHHPLDLESKLFICFLSAPEKQIKFLQEMQRINQKTHIVFIALGFQFAVLANGNYEIIATESSSYVHVFQHIQEKYKKIDAVLYMWSLDAECWNRDYFPVVSILQAIPVSAIQLDRIILIGMFTKSLDRCYLESWQGFKRSLRLVLPKIQVGIIIQEDNGITETSVEDFAQKISGEQQLILASTVLFQKGKRHELSVIPTSLVKHSEDLNTAIRETILITGGCGALGLGLTEHLAKKNPNFNFVLIGRSELTAEKRKNIERITATGVSVMYVQANVCDAQSMRVGLIEAKNCYGSIDGVIHAAGVVDERTIFQKNFDAFKQVLAPKIEGTMVLDDVLKEEPLKFIYYFSSSSAILGDFGSCDYAVGNRFEMSYVRHFNALAANESRIVKACVINWPLWKEGGMRIGNEAQTDFYLKSSGLCALTFAEGFDVFDKITGKSGQYLVMSGQKSRVYQTLGLTKRSSLKSKFQIETNFVEVPRPDLAGLSVEQCIEEDLLTMVMQLLDIPRKRLHLKNNLSDYGFDSINLIEFSRRLSAHFKVEVTPAVFFGYSTLEKLIAYFMEHHPVAVKVIYKKNTDDSPVLSTTLSCNQQLPEVANVARSLNSNPKSNLAPIAIIGMSGRFPAARSIEALWTILERGENCVTKIPGHDSVERPDWQKYKDISRENAKNKEDRWAGLIPGIEEFDPLFFEISPHDAELMDPRQRHILQETWKALEDAGYGINQIEKNKIGMFVGVEESNYKLPKDKETLTGTHAGILASGVAYFLNLSGPVMAINTACSSSLVAMHQAILSLRSGECRSAIVAGVNLIPNADIYSPLSKMGMLSADGKCFAFDKKANGMVPGEAVVSIVVKLLSQAELDNDRIHAVIRGSGINYDGKTNGMTAPSTTAQEALLKSVYLDNNINPECIDYVITHGTGTKLGDSVEINALVKAFEHFTSQTHFCALTSTKTNLGHTFAASGLVSVVSLIESFKHGCIPASLHCDEDSTYVSQKDSPFYINKKKKNWPKPADSERTGAVSAFGMSGTNAHLVIEEYTNKKEIVFDNMRYCILPLSARSSEALQQKVEEMLHFIEGKTWEKNDFLSLCYTLQDGRHHFEHRSAIVANGIDEALTLWKAQQAEQYHPHLFLNKVAFEFREQTALKQYANELARQRYTTTECDYSKCRENLCALAALYCQGYSIGWDLFYGDQKPKKMSLPGYAFLREKYWIDQNQQQIVESNNMDSSIGIDLMEPYELMSFKEVWQVSDLSFEQDKDVVTEFKVMVCFLSDAEKQLEFIKLIQKYDVQTKVIFVSAGSDYVEEGEQYYLIAKEAYSYIRVLQSIKRKHKKVDSIYYLWSLDSSDWNIDYFPVVSLLQAISVSELSVRKLMLAAQFEDDLERCYLESWHGFKISLRLALPKTEIGLVLQENNTTHECELEDFFKKIWHEQQVNKSETVWYRAEKRHELRIVPKAFTCHEDNLAHRLQGTILITGGCGGIGFHFAKHIANTAIKRNNPLHLILMGRSKLTAGKKTNIAELESLGCSVAYLQADVCDIAGFKKGLIAAKSHLGGINGVIHAAGIQENKNIFQSDYANFKQVLAANIDGTLAIDEVLENEPLNFICYFSSSSAILGDFGSCSYAVGNRFEMGYAQYRNTLANEGKRAGKSFVINWPLWKDGGMSIGEEEQTEFYLKSSGQRLLISDEGFEVFDKIVSQEETQCLVIVGRRSRVHRFLGITKGVPDIKPHLQTSMLLDSLKSKRYSENSRLSVSEYLTLDLRRMVSDLLKMPLESVDPKENLANYGFDSISLTNFASSLTAFYKFEISSSLFFHYSTLAKLKAYFLEAHTKRMNEFYQENDELFEMDDKRQKEDQVLSITKSTFSELIHLNNIKAGRPMFWFHAGLGGVQPYYEIAQHIERPFYGIQARGWQTDHKPIEGIEKIAAYYIQIIKSIQPTGPYDFGGFSLGGLIAYEVTRQLQVLGELVDSIIMIDTPPPKYLSGMRVSCKSEILQSVNYMIASAMMQDPEYIKEKLIHRDALIMELDDDIFLEKTMELVEKNGLNNNLTMHKKINQMISVQRAYHCHSYELRPLSEPTSVKCYYFRNKSELFFGEMAPFFMVEESLTAWDHHDYITDWQQQLPAFQLIDLDSANHIMLLSDPVVYDAVINFCKNIFNKKENTI